MNSRMNTADAVFDDQFITINPASNYFNIVIVRLDRTIQNLLKRLDSPIKSGNDKHYRFMCLPK